MTTPLYLALIMLVGLAGGKIANKLSLPSLTGYIIGGMLLGPSLLNIVTTDIYNSFSIISSFAIGMITLSVGLELHRDVIKKDGKKLSKLSLINTLLTAFLVTLATWALGLELQLAVILGVISMTVSPAGVLSIVKEKKASGELTSNLIHMVAFDNLICIVLFSFVLTIVQRAGGGAGFSILTILFSVVSDIVVGFIIGLATGTLFSYFVRKDTSPDKLLALLAAVIFLNNGLSGIIGVSPILTSIFSGMVITNLTIKQTLITSVFNRLELPVFVLFFTLSGAHIDISIILSVGLIGLGYIIARAFGRWFGVFIASKVSDVSSRVGKYLGLGLFPQSGVAIGLATVGEQSLTNTGGVITGVVLMAVIAFEVFGPLILERALDAIGDAKV